MTVPGAAFVFLFPLAGVAVVLTFVIALIWLGARRSDRQAFYLSEMVRKLGESSAWSAPDFLREYERAKTRRRREGLTVAGLVGSLAAVGLMVFLHAVATEAPHVYLVGLIPLLPSVGILIYARLPAPRD